MPSSSAARKVKVTTLKNTKLNTVKLNWKQVFFTNCPMVSANNIDQELGWCKQDFKAKGIDYSYFRSRRKNDFYPHYILRARRDHQEGTRFGHIAAYASTDPLRHALRKSLSATDTCRAPARPSAARFS